MSKPRVVPDADATSAVANLSTKRIDMRGILHFLFILASLPLYSPAASASLKGCRKIRRVVVVGAGISGVTAAYRIATSRPRCYQVNRSTPEG